MKKSTTPNARFWHMLPNCNWVKLTVRPEKPLTIHRSWDNGEGTSWESDTYQIEGDDVANYWSSGGRDCDGVVKGGGTMLCPIDKLKSREHWEIKGFMLPTWTKQEQWQRDYSAEAANY